ncbi:hypothetical protein PPERSA_06872 [Pseudocohnilembus persalinus]|uniref:Uncharacterized protein n=1 Tax=Pseudocohnilembus persalinus TaxID=266149 RepID=A0A0V0QSL0_PSEPJ|nr:hypothetical protein PPERSA_06872 [Pseudocohnilembus persalinus]|eukprot:KRX05238.1 hypothetical protein PPERSA_06872 [Pseudocohnilembus persalinus]
MQDHKNQSNLIERRCDEQLSLQKQKNYLNKQNSRKQLFKYTLDQIKKPLNNDSIVYYEEENEKQTPYNDSRNDKLDFKDQNLQNQINYIEDINILPPSINQSYNNQDQNSQYNLLDKGFQQEGEELNVSNILQQQNNEQQDQNINVYIQPKQNINNINQNDQQQHQRNLNKLNSKNILDEIILEEER